MMKNLAIRFNLAVLSVVSLLSASMVWMPQAQAAACTAPATDYGTVTSTVTITTAGTYHIWSRMSAPDSASNNYLLEVDGGTCFAVAGNVSGTYASGATTFFQSGTQNWTKTTTSSTTVSMSLTAGTHTIKMIGTAANVYLDRVVMTTDAACTPTGTGDNCANPPDTTPPVVNIASPVDGATPSSPLTVTVNATDDDGGSVASVGLWVDNATGTGTATYTDTVAPYSFANIALTPGTHTLLAKATNASGYSSTSSLVTITVPDTTAPSAASITAPANGSSQSGTITVTATGTDNVGVTKIEFYADGTLFGTDSVAAGGFSATLDTTTLSNASHNLTAKVFDAAGNSKTSAAVAILVNNATGGTDTTPPTVTLPAPFNVANSIIAGKAYPVSANVADSSGIKSVEFQVDGVTRATVTTAPFSFNLDTTTLTTGAHTLRVRSTDNSVAGNVSTFVSIAIRVTDVTDVNRNCVVNFQDISSVIPNLGLSGSQGAVDVNENGVVNFQDISSVIPKLGQTPC